MIGYSTIGVKDIEKAKKFYTELFDAKVQVDIGRLAMIGKAMDAPMIAVCKPFDGKTPSCGNGSMVAFSTSSKEEVNELYNKAISLGATSEGAPGQRIDDVFYGAYVRDPDGNKMAFYIFG
ncbi:putative lactoylglutathione lyase [Sulfitobacter undariae]|uniref:Putative lactoylglutathione lyase n=1 Tax=Sulfitobacter undariae TaxID=1563671 RepID=A0A7W6H2E0_9RHOB|nr:VOC family protein [Sulfitobacter undariae]MBB3996002.1 putative lactoylglutathione lyase [Sulfitobacter undariae]